MSFRIFHTCSVSEFDPCSLETISHFLHSYFGSIPNTFGSQGKLGLLPTVWNYVVKSFFWFLSNLTSYQITDYFNLSIFSAGFVLKLNPSLGSLKHCSIYLWTKLYDHQLTLPLCIFIFIFLFSRFFSIGGMDLINRYLQFPLIVYLVWWPAHGNYDTGEGRVDGSSFFLRSRKYCSSLVMEYKTILSNQ